MKKTSLIIRILAVILLISLLPLALFSCASNKNVSAKKVVGEVDGEKIYYDELYFLIKTYESSLKAKHANDAAALASALDKLAREELIANVAMLRLCEAHGLTYKNRDLKDTVNQELDAILTNDFDGDEEAFRTSMAEVGLTERYLRYTLGVDSLYNQLLTVYPDEGLVVSTEQELKAYIMENFIRVYHIALYNDTPEENEANLNKMLEARRKLVNGNFTMYDMLHGSKTETFINALGKEEKRVIDLSAYNEDFSDLSGDGYYLTRGSWDPTYENAAFALELGKFSNVVHTMATHPKTGEKVPTYYVIQRFAMDKDYIDENLAELQEEYYTSVIYSDLMKTREGLTFEPNEFYESLDLANLLPPREGVNVTVLVLCLVGGAVLLGGGITAFVIVKRKKK